MYQVSRQQLTESAVSGMNKGTQQNLLNKMTAEQAEYTRWLSEQKPGEILTHTLDFTVREEIIKALEFTSLTTEQAEALLESPTPLNDCFQQYRDLGSDRLHNARISIERCADALLKKRWMSAQCVPLYRQTSAYAREHDELAAFRASRKANETCQKAVDMAIRGGWDGSRLTVDVGSLLKTFSTERVLYILSATLQKRIWDRRFSRSNMEWAKNSFSFNEKTLDGVPELETHSCILDDFVSKVRKATVG